MNSYIFKFCKQYSLYLLTLFVIALTASFLDFSVSYKIKEILDALATSGENNLNWLIALFVALKAASHGIYFLYRLLNIRYLPMILENSIKTIYSKAIGHSLHWFDSHLSGEISSKIIDFQNNLTIFVIQSFFVLRGIVTILISLWFLTKINMLTASVLGVFIIIYSPIIFILIKKQLRLQESCVAARQSAVGIINDSISNIFSIKIIGNVFTELKLKLQPALSSWKNADKKAQQFDAYFIDCADTAMVVLMSAVQIYLLARLHQAGEITAGGFAFIAIITLNLHSQLSGLLERLLFTVNPAFASMKASYDFINRSYDVCDKVGAKKIGKARGEIVYSDVTFSYGDQNKIIFKDFNLHVKQGERLGIVGKTGAGKSTLIKSFLRYLDLEKGYISIDGDRIIDITQESLWQNVSLVPQDITMFHRTIRENLLIAKSDASDEEMFAACKLANIHDDILLMRGGYNSVVGERGAKLSGGQRQRIALARAVLKNASIMILDEATSSLDTQTEQLIQASIHNVLESSGATVLVVAHRLSTLRHMDRIIVLDKGTIVEEGSHEDLIGNENGLYFKLWNAQVGLQQI